MPEDEGERGRIANERLNALFEQLGWSKQNGNVDIPCSAGIHTDRTTDHGVDSYFSYDDPYRESERGVFVESKMRQWDGVNIGSVGDFQSQIMEVVECVPEADEFEERLNSYENRNCRTGILAIWSGDEFHEDDFQRYVSEAKVRRKERGTYKIAVFGNSELNKLARLAKKYNEIKQNNDGEHDSVNFYYPSMVDKPFPHRRKSLSLEYMMSDIIYATIENPVTQNGEVVGYNETTAVFYYGDFTIDSLDVLFQSMVAYNMLDTDGVEIYYDMEFLDRDLQDIESAKTLFKQNITPDDEDTPEFKFVQLPTITYDAYTERLRGE
jgi:hypothetical protein